MMKPIVLLALLAISANAAEKALFNGKDLTGWSGDPAIWSVEDGVIVGKTSPDAPIEQNTFLIWKGGEVSDFTLTLKFKMTGSDQRNVVAGGIQYRSKVEDAAKYIVTGYQADLEYHGEGTGSIYEEKGRSVLAQRGQRVRITQSENPKRPKLTVLGEASKKEEIEAAIDKDGWNEFKIIAVGGNIQHYVNGKFAAEAFDETAEGAKKGVIAFQIQTGPAQQFEFKDIVLEEK
jgi:hypothetical protein